MVSSTCRQVCRPDASFKTFQHLPLAACVAANHGELMQRAKSNGKRPPDFDVLIVEGGEDDESRETKVLDQNLVRLGQQGPGWVFDRPVRFASDRTVGVAQAAAGPLS